MNNTKRKFPLWDQFIDRKDEWIGGKLTEDGESTPIKDIQMNQVGDGYVFSIVGEDWTDEFNVDYGGVSACGIPNSIGFYCMGGLSFTITKP